MLFFFYVYRSLIARFRANAITMLSVALFVAGCTLGLAFYFSLTAMLRSAPPENIIVIARGASSESGSMLAIDSARKVVLLDGVKKTGESPLAARELLSRVYVDTISVSVYKSPVVIRGIDDRSFDVHGAKLLSGAAAAPGSLDIILGKRVTKLHPTLAIGSEIALPAGAGRVVGMFSANGSPYEDEIWTPRAALELHVKAKVSSSVTLVAETASAVPALVEKINTSKDLNALAVPLATFREDKFGLRSLARTVFILLLMLSIVATSAIAMTMNAAAVVRMPEFAAMAAIGIRRSVLRRLVLLESLLLAVFGALFGIGVSLLIQTKIGEISIKDSPIELTMGAWLPAIGVGLGLVVGLLGGLPPAITVGRLDIVRALR